jgi:hypothetical protein
MLARLALGLLLGLIFWFVLIGGFVEGSTRAMVSVGRSCHFSRHLVHDFDQAAAMIFFILAVPMVGVSVIDLCRCKGDIRDLLEDFPLHMPLSLFALYLCFGLFVLTFFLLLAFWIGCGALNLVGWHR